MQTKEQRKVEERKPLLKTNSAVFGAGPINIAFPSWFMTLFVIAAWCVTQLPSFWLHEFLSRRCS